ncbi:hypothetical protein D9615_005540 [Tricholomella constricta]|uniref:Uncharacterized protein n=1 Tax=Tricholomella constricta TaxID=117010 RepID=A0A8H5HDN9_9AGAR|nr:hypothetical protein D9615_005540 [Tricholomella constricta]
MLRRSPGPNWTVITEPSSEDDESQEDELALLTLKRKGPMISGPRSSPKRQKLGPSDEYGIGGSIKAPSSNIRLEESNQTGSSSSNTASRPQGVWQRPPGRHDVHSATSPPASVSPPSQLPPSTISRHSVAKDMADLLDPLKAEAGSSNGPVKVKSSAATLSRPKSAEMRRFPEIIEISSDDDTPPPRPKAPHNQRVASYQGPPSGIQISKRPTTQTRRTFPTASAGRGVIVLDDSDDETSPTSTPIASSSRPRPPMSQIMAKRKPSEDQIMRDASPERRIGISTKPLRLVTTEASVIHKEALSPRMADNDNSSKPKRPYISDIAGPSEKAVNEHDSNEVAMESDATTSLYFTPNERPQSSSTQRPANKLPPLHASVGLKQSTAWNSTPGIAPANAKAPTSMSKPLPKIPLPGRKRPSVSGPSIPVPSEAIEPKSPKLALHPKREVVAPSRVPIPSSPSRRMDMRVATISKEKCSTVKDVFIIKGSAKSTGFFFICWTQLFSKRRTANPGYIGALVSLAICSEGVATISKEKCSTVKDVFIIKGSAKSTGFFFICWTQLFSKRRTANPGYIGALVSLAICSEGVATISKEKCSTVKDVFIIKSSAKSTGFFFICWTQLFSKRRTANPGYIGALVSLAICSEGVVNIAKKKCSTVKDVFIIKGSAKSTGFFSNAEPPTSSASSVGSRRLDLRHLSPKQNQKMPPKPSDTSNKSLMDAIAQGLPQNSIRPAQESSRADVIDLTNDDDSDEEAVSRHAKSLDPALKVSPLRKSLVKQEASPRPSSPRQGRPYEGHEKAPLSLGKNFPSPSTFAAAALKNHTSIVPRPMPLPTPRVSNKISAPSPHTKSTEPAKELHSTTPRQESDHSKAAASKEVEGERSSGSSGSESSSVSTSSDIPAPPTSGINLPQRTARKSAKRVPHKARSSTPASSSSPSGTPERAPPSPAFVVGSSTIFPLAAAPLSDIPKSANIPRPLSRAATIPPPLSQKSRGIETPHSSPHNVPQSVMLASPEPKSLTMVATGASESGLHTDDQAPEEVSSGHGVNALVAAEPPASPEQDHSDLEYVDAPLPEPVREDSSDMMDVERLLTSSAPDSRGSSLARQSSPESEILDIAAVDEALEQPRRSTRSSRSASDEPINCFPDDSSVESPAESPVHSPTPEDSSIPVPIKFFGGFASLNWKTYRQNLDNFKPKCYFARDLPHALQDNINQWPEYERQRPGLVHVLESAIQENTADDEPDAPLIEIVNEVDNDPTPPWEFYYSNKMWHGEDVPPPDMTQLVSCNCMGKCDPKSKTCACLQRQRNYTSGVTPDFVYDSKGRLKVSDYPIFECNDLCGCGDECRNRVVQHGRKCAVKIQKTQEKGWGVFAGSKKIYEGTFIGIYAGELLTDREGESRGITYNKFGRTYLFDLDFHHLKEGVPDWDIQYTVDAYHAGNNHSCDPNCQLVSCYINESDIQKPLLTVFARRDIEPGEELCFSYYGNPNDDEDAIPVSFLKRSISSG